MKLTVMKWRKWCWSLQRWWVDCDDDKKDIDDNDEVYCDDDEKDFK